MTRETLDNKMQSLLDDILTLGNLVEHAIINSVKALKERDLDLAKTIYDSDKKINKKRYKIERTTVTVIATQQPMAKDLRILASIMEVAGEIERMGDYAKGIALITLRLKKEPHPKPLKNIPKMAKLTADMLHRSLDAFINADVDTAMEIPKEDDKVDDLYNKVYRELLSIMMEDPSTIDRATFLLWVAHNLERVADRVTNICERTRFVATGKLKEIDISDDEQF